MLPIEEMGVKGNHTGKRHAQRIMMWTHIDTSRVASWHPLTGRRCTRLLQKSPYVCRFV